MPCQNCGAAFRQSEVSAACDLQKAGLNKIGLRPVDAVGEHRLLTTWQELVSFILGQAQLVREPDYAVPDARLPLRPELQHGQHQCLIVWDCHVVRPPVAESGMYTDLGRNAAMI